MLFHILSVEFLSNKHLSFPQGNPIQACPLNLEKHRAVLWEEPSLKARKSSESRESLLLHYLHFVNFSLRESVEQWKSHQSKGPD